VAQVIYARDRLHYVDEIDAMSMKGSCPREKGTRCRKRSAKGGTVGGIGGMAVIRRSQVERE
jgi:hypothetical protein